MNFITVKDLKKSYGKHEAVKGISFDVKKQDFFAFLGPNGAGKSTTINMLCSLLEKNSGEVFINGFELGKDDDAIRKSIGIVFQTHMLDERLSVKENLMIRGRFYNLDKKRLFSQIEKLTKELSMDAFINQKYGTLSGGQKRRADIARALINEPKLLILDEPTTGLDPKTREDVWAYIEELRKKDMTIFLTTHYMEEAAKASKVAIINQGVIVAEGTPTQLKSNYSYDRLKLEGNLKAMRAYFEKEAIEYDIKESLLYVKIASKEAIQHIQALESQIHSFEMIQGSMDDVFLNLTGRELNQ